MKRIITLFTLISVLLCLFSCGCSNEFDFEIHDGEVGYHHTGLYFKLPESFVKKQVTYSENCYSDTNGAAFFFDCYSSTGIEETLGYDGDITVEDYTKKFVILNGLEVKDYYIPERNISVIDYEYSYPTGVLEDEYYLHMIMRGTSHLYIINMSCPLAMLDTYKPLFDELVEIIYAE